MPDSKSTDITIVLDRSGSMESCREESVVSFNQFAVATVVLSRCQAPGVSSLIPEQG